MKNNKYVERIIEEFKGGAFTDEISAVESILNLVSEVPSPQKEALFVQLVLENGKIGKRRDLNFSKAA